VKAIAEKAHRCGAKVILDAYHSVGIIPVDVWKLGIDILVGGVLKWLCGGPGGAFLWVRPSLRKKITPKITGWFAHQEPFAFAPTMQYSRDATRFLNGTPSIPALYAAAEGPKIISDVDVQNIRKKSKHQTALLIQRANRYGYNAVTPFDPECRAGTVTLSVPHAYEVSRELLEREIIVDYRRGAGIRIAPHFYNKDEEVVHAIDEIKGILESRAYLKHSKTRTKIT
jgi:kynureninase